MANETRCDLCPEYHPQVAVFRISATDLDGVVLDTHDVCEDCIPMLFVTGQTAPKKNGGESDEEK